MNKIGWAAMAAACVLVAGISACSDATLSPVQPEPSAAVPDLSDALPEPNPVQMFGNYPLASVGYSISEFFISGAASSYSSSRPLGSDGKWSVVPDATAPYKTRLVVVQPVDRNDFSGTVIVEWFNVTSGLDQAVDWLYTHREIIREGHAYVGVSAQAVGVNQLLESDPARYGSLGHPGDSYSYDMYSQAGMAVREWSATLLPGLQVRSLIADGESQSAGRLTTYVNALAPLVNVYDGYLIHSRGGGSPAVSVAPEADVPAPETVFIRDDLTVPVLTLQTETDVLGISGFLPARQPDNTSHRLWEVAGTAHVDIYVAQQAGDDTGTIESDVAQFSSMT